MNTPVLIRVLLLAAAACAASSAQTPVTVTLRNGTHRSVTLEGVGCDKSMCSRVFVDTRARDASHIAKTRLDTIASIKEITKDDALFLFKDGTQRRQSVVLLNRILYIQTESGRSEKLDLNTVKSLEF